MLIVTIKTNKGPPALKMLVIYRHKTAYKRIISRIGKLTRRKCTNQGSNGGRKQRAPIPAMLNGNVLAKTQIINCMSLSEELK